MRRIEMKQVFAFMVGALLCAMQFPLPVYAEETVDHVTRYDEEYNVNDGSVVIRANGDYHIVGKGEATTNTIQVAPGVKANITMENVNIDVSTVENACAFDMTGAEVHLTLEGQNALKSGGECAGLQVPPGAFLTIEKESTGSLEIEQSEFGAGIGGAFYGSAGAIMIDGGTITVTGTTGTRSAAGAGIGGGLFGDGGNITITGGNVTVIGTTAKGMTFGAGIGGGNDGAGGNITITGGNVTVTGTTGEGTTWGAGIGGGNDAAGGNIIITGRNVTVIETTGTGKAFGAGIGGGKEETGNWNGIIARDPLYEVHGNPVVRTDITIPSDHYLAIDPFQTLTIGEDATLLNEGMIFNDGMIINQNKITNNGEIENIGTIVNVKNGMVTGKAVALNEVETGTLDDDGTLMINGKFAAPQSKMIGASQTGLLMAIQKSIVHNFTSQ